MVDFFGPNKAQWSKQGLLTVPTYLFVRVRAGERPEDSNNDPCTTALFFFIDVSLCSAAGRDCALSSLPETTAKD
jgi:hypothetical protein